MNAYIQRGVFLVLLISLLSISGQAASRPLGEGCAVAEFSNACEQGCRWECEGTHLVKKCYQDFGYCFGDGQSCYECDFKQVSDTCGQINSLNCGANLKNANDALFCRDNDGDSWAVESSCVKRSQLQSIPSNYKSEFDILGFDECHDNDPELNGNTIWVRDEDQDGFWGEVLFQCGQPEGDGWTREATAPIDDQYDCDDTQATTTNPVGCFCKQEHIGVTYNGAVCVDTQSKSATTIQNTVLQTFPVIREASTRVWLPAETRTDFNGDGTILCPEDQCPLRWKQQKLCVEPNTFWYEPSDRTSNSAQQGGDHLCMLHEGKATWTTRTGTLNAMLTKMGEASGKDFTVYCDNINTIAHTLSLNIFFPLGSMEQYLTALTGLKQNQQGAGKGCILTINEPYTQQIGDEDVPEEEAQKVVFGLTMTQEIDDTKYFEIDFSNKQEESGWLIGREGNVRNGLFANKNFSLLLVAQASDNGVDSELDHLFDQIINPNSFWINLFNFLRNPLQQLQEITSPTPFSNVLFGDFDKSFVSKQGNTYVQSILEEGTLAMKIVNPSESEGKRLGTFLEQTCNEGLEGKPVHCTQEANIVGITAQGVDETFWEQVSRRIRLQESSASGVSSFYDAQCTDVTDCQPDVCQNAVACSAVGLCEFAPKQPNAVTPDGCCPVDLTSLEDADCAPPPELQLNISSTIKGSCDPSKNEVVLLSMNQRRNAHAAFGRTYQYKMCLAPEIGEFTVHAELNCNKGTKVASLSSFTNAHIAGPNDQTYNHDICIEHSIYDLACKQGSEESCQGWNTVLSMTETTNAHIGDPEQYPTKICCRWIGYDTQSTT